MTANPPPGDRENRANDRDDWPDENSDRPNDRESTDGTDHPVRTGSDESSAGGGGFAGLLRGLIETIQRLEETDRSIERQRGRRRSGGTAFEYDYSVAIGPGAPVGDAVDESTDESDHPVSVRETVDGAVATIDLPGVDPETLRAGVHGRRLSVASDEDQVVRLTLPRSGFSIDDATYNNGVLEIALRDEESEVMTDD